MTRPFREAARDFLLNRGLNARLLHYAFRAWLIEIAISGFNFFVLMNLVYEPRVGYLAAHQIGMATRIVYIFVIAWFLLRKVREYTPKDLWHAGFFWLALTLIFEWGGSFIMRRPVPEIVEGWNIPAGFMWPYVLVAYTFSIPVVGTLFHPGQKRGC